MKTTMADNIIHIVILDISGIYAQIHNDGYFSSIEVEQIKYQYSDKNKWKIVTL